MYILRMSYIFGLSTCFISIFSSFGSAIPQFICNDTSLCLLTRHDPLESDVMFQKGLEIVV